MRIAIVGAGVFGLASAWELCRREHQVHLFERSTIPAPDASSTDISKTIRLEYGAATERYAPLVTRAFERWREAERLTGDRVLHQTGVLFLVRRYRDGEFEFESHRQLVQMGHAVEVYSAAEAARRWPVFNWDGLEAGVFNPLGGWLASGKALTTLARCVRAVGGQIHEQCPVLEVDHHHLLTAQGQQTFDQVLVTAGPWVKTLLSDLDETVRISRQRITHYRPVEPKVHDYPVWVYDMANSGWYGFGANPEGVVKVALHARSESADPNCSRTIDQDFLATSREFVGDLIPSLGEAEMSGHCCLYTNSPGGDFVLDRHPSGCLVAGCGSGHAFKFGPVLGELVADLVEHDRVDPAFRLGAEAVGETW